MSDKFPGFLAISLAYIFLQGYFFNLGYFYHISNLQINPYLDFSDIVNTSSSGIIFSAFLGLATWVLGLITPNRKSVYWITSTVFLMWVAGSTYSAIASHDSLHGDLIIKAVLFAIFCYFLTYETFQRTTINQAYFGLFLIALLMLPASMLNGYTAFDKQSKIKFNLYIKDSKESVTLTNFRNLEAGFFGIDKDGKPKVFSKETISSFAQQDAIKSD